MFGGRWCVGVTTVVVHPPSFEDAFSSFTRPRVVVNKNRRRRFCALSFRLLATTTAFCDAVVAAGAQRRYLLLPTHPTSCQEKDGLFTYVLKNGFPIGGGRSRCSCLIGSLS
jgi:hypothetical protein